MQITRRGQTIVACIIVLTVLGILFNQHTTLITAGVLGAYLLGVQGAFLWQVKQHAENSQIQLDTATSTVVAGEQTAVTGQMLTDQPSLSAELQLSLPAGTEIQRTDVKTETETPDAEFKSKQTKTAVANWSVAGTFQIKRPEVKLWDPQGMFTESYTANASTEVTVQAQQADTVQIGKAGEEVVSAFGEHKSEQRGFGIEPTTVRQYVPGDEMRQIDWNATARLQDTFIVESETETDQKTVLFVDHRNTTGIGEEGQRPIEYIRYAGLALLQELQDTNDPVGLHGIGDQGITHQVAVRSNPEHYEYLRRVINELEVTLAESAEEDWLGKQPQAVADGGTDAASATNAAQQLKHDATAFGTQLQPLFAGVDPYIHNVDTHPLLRTVQTVLSDTKGAVRSIILTDDQHRGELKETVRLASQGNNSALVLIAPEVLFNPDGETNLDEAYRAYVSFEQYRRELDRASQTTVLEVGPGERIEAILSTRGEQS